MDVRTGKIKEFGSQEALRKALEEAEGSLVEVDKADMTDKQKEQMQVSLHDTKSKLGKKLQKKRKELGYSQMSRNQRRNLRKKLK